MKVHRHEEQFDGGLHAWCGRGDTTASIEQFEATPQALRCGICDRDWFPRGQPDWHYRQAVANWKTANVRAKPGATVLRCDSA